MRTVFLDRDGVINENRDDHVKSWQEFTFIPGSLEALRLLTRAGYRIFVVTNQAAVNRGQLSHAGLAQIHARMLAAANLAGARISGIRYCPHRPEEHCDCRKPSPGMLKSLAAEHHVDTARAYIVGDAITDIAAGQAVGCRGVLVTTGRGADQLRLPDAQRHRPAHVARDLLAAANWIIADAQGRTTHPPLIPMPRGTIHPEPAI